MPPPSSAARERESARDPRTIATRVLSGALLVLLTAIWWWSSAGDEEPQAPTPAVIDARPSPPTAPEQGAGVERTMLAEEPPRAPEPTSPPPPDVDLDHAWQHQLALRFVDRYGLPVPDATAYVAPPGCALARWPDPTDARGELIITFAAKQRTVQLSLTAMAWGETQAVQRFECDAEHPAERTLVLRGKAQTQDALEHVRRRDLRDLQRDASRVQEDSRRSDRASRDELDILCGRSQFLFRMFECVMCHDQSRLQRHAALAQAPTAATQLHPHARFWEPVATVGALELAMQRERRPPEPEAEAAARQRRLPPRGTQLWGSVRDARGKPAADQPVVALAADGAVLHRTLTDARGRYRIDGLQPGPVRLAAGGAEQGRTETVLEIAGERQSWDCRLELQSVVRGVVRDPQGQPLVGWLVEFERDDGRHADLTATDADGRFLFPDAFGQGTCRLWRGDGSDALPVRYGAVALPDSTPLPFDLAAGVPVRARLRVSPLLPPRYGRATVDVRVTQLETGCSAPMPPLNVDDAFEIEGLPPGPYLVEFGVPVLGIVETGPVHVDGRGLWDLGRISLAAPGRVHVVPATGEPSPLDGEFAFYHRTDAFDVRATTRQLSDDLHEIRAGHHLLLWRADGVVRAVEFDVQAGITTTLRVPTWRGVR
ncbi:MAG: carboxypeptidase regulatory-like domain-containing protein [Planctomycetes bacterium]|nr:carboxypeptidase regulatory-like domain-containing protein [Planctomycetota bacterium]